MSKNVLYIGGFELPDKNAAAQRVIANAKIFSSLGYNVIFIGVDKSDGFEEHPISNFNLDGFEFSAKPQKYPISKINWIKFITDFSFVKKTIETDLNSDVGIVVAYNYPAITLNKLIRYGKKNKIKIIADVTEWYEPQGNILFKIIKGFDSYLRMNVFQKQIDGVIAISQYLYNHYSDNNVIKLPPLVDKASSKWDKAEELKGEYKYVIKLIYVGSPGNGQKDRLDLIIKLLSQVKENIYDFKLSIIGITHKQYTDFFGENSIPQNVINSIVFKGRKPHMEAIKEIKRSDFSIFMRDNNLVNTAGFPTKLVESISCGTPIITNNSSNITDYLKEGKTGFVLNDSTTDSLNKSLTKALNVDIVKVQDMKRNCLDFEQFNYPYYKNDFIKFISNL